jgi:peptidylprolyl isomerase
VRRSLLVAVLLAIAALAFACKGSGGGDGDATPTSDLATPPAESPAPDASPAVPMPTPMTYAEAPAVTIGEKDKLFANVETVKGAFRIKLRPDLALVNVNSFVFLAREGYYDGVTFHRVLPGFVAQGGDPTGTGSGGPGYNLPDEFSDVKFDRGVVAMANTGAPNSAGSQFFVVYDRADHLDGLLTVIGEVVEGMDVVDSLTPRDPDNLAPGAPPGDQIITITIDEG